MHRFFISSPPPDDGSVEILGSDAKHAVRVLRLAEGDSFVAVLPGDGQYLARIIEALPRRVRAVLEGKVKTATEPRTRVTLFQGLPKGDKMEQVIGRCTEIGVHRVVPVISDRTVATPDQDRVASRITRWRRIATEASELAGRTKVPLVSEPISYAAALSQASEYDLRLMPWEEEQSVSLRQALKQSLLGSQTTQAPEDGAEVAGKNVFLLIGPEGGFSQREADEARARGVLPVTLGPRMMRTENAGAVALALILYEIGDMD